MGHVKKKKKKAEAVAVVAILIFISSIFVIQVNSVVNVNQGEWKVATARSKIRSSCDKNSD